MPTHTEQQFSPYNTQQLFDLALDIERYPEFLPWCRAARITQRKDGEMLAELVISFNHLSESYTSRVTYVRPKSPQDNGAIEVAMVQGPFDHLVNRWKFTPHDGGCDLHFFLDFKFRSRLLETLIGGMFTRATAKMVGAFKARADQLYGKPS